MPEVFRFEYELVKAAPALSLREFIENGGRPMFPLSSFVSNPILDSAAPVKTDLENLPNELGSVIIIPSADLDLRREIERRGFFPKESNQALVLMYRQFPDGVLYAEN